MALMAGYAAAMDASMSEGGSTQDVTAAVVSGSSSHTELSDPQEGPSGLGRGPSDWESQVEEELGADKTSLSNCVSESSCKKSISKGELAATCGAGGTPLIGDPDSVRCIFTVSLFSCHQCTNLKRQALLLLPLSVNVFFFCLSLCPCSHFSSFPPSPPVLCSLSLPSLRGNLC